MTNAELAAAVDTAAADWTAARRAARTARAAAASATQAARDAALAWTNARDALTAALETQQQELEKE